MGCIEAERWHLCQCRSTILFLLFSDGAMICFQTHSTQMVTSNAPRPRILLNSNCWKTRRIAHIRMTVEQERDGIGGADIRQDTLFRRSPGDGD